MEPAPFAPVSTQHEEPPPPPRPGPEQGAPIMIRRLLYELRFFWIPLVIVLSLAGILLLLTSGLSGRLLTGYTAF